MYVFFSFIKKNAIHIISLTLFPYCDNQIKHFSSLREICLWCRGVVAPWCSGHHYSTTSFNKAWTQVLRRFKSCSSEIRDGEDLWQWSRLKIRLNTFCRSTIPQKQFIIIIVIIIIIINGKIQLLKTYQNSVVFHGISILHSKKKNCYCNISANFLPKFLDPHFVGNMAKGRICILVTSVLRFALLPYYRRFV